MIAALLAVLLHAILSLPVLHVRDAVTSAAAYFATTMLLTPLVTILGARRPGIAAWHWFVVLPMVVVLQWPALSQLFSSHGRATVELSAPATMGVVVVLMMSAGTFLGTSSTGVALVYSSGIVMLLASATGNRSAQFPVTAFAPFLILTAMWIARQNLNGHLNRLRVATTASQRTQAVGELFSSLYGFAWTRARAGSDQSVRSTRKMVRAADFDGLPAPRRQHADGRRSSATSGGLHLGIDTLRERGLAATGPEPGKSGQR